MGRYREQAGQRRGWLVAGLVLAVLCALAAGYNFSQTWTGKRLRFAVASAFTGYDGCLCDDCAAYFLGVQATPRRYCGGCRGVTFGHQNWAMVWGGSSLACIAGFLLLPLAPPLHRTHDPLTCAHCGYDLCGLPGSICPECGQRAEKAAGTENE